LIAPSSRHHEALRLGGASISLAGFSGEGAMSLIKNAVVRLWHEEAGGEVIEYALILGLIIVVAIALVGAVGTKVVARWTSVNSSM
jgi:Flp pilus assembly pilin Flp